MRLKVPGIGERLAEQLVDAIRRIRTLDLKKRPAISETLDWAQALLALQVEDLSPGRASGHAERHLQVPLGCSKSNQRKIDKILS